MSESSHEPLLAMFAAGDIDGAATLLERNPAILQNVGYDAHPLLREFVSRNHGHCYRQAHLQIADLLIPAAVRDFRAAVLKDQVDEVRQQLAAEASLVHAEFTAGRGISRAIHHWQSFDIGRQLIDAGADLDVLTTRDDSPLTMQLRFGTLAGARLLLERGANPNGGTGGHMPAESMAELIELMLDYGWDINRGQLLHDANHGHGTRVITWLKYGADPRATDQSGRTALHLLAARGAGREAIRALVAAGADVEQVDNDGQTPLALARQAKRRAAEDALVALGAGE